MRGAGTRIRTRETASSLLRLLGRVALPWRQLLGLLLRGTEHTPKSWRQLLRRLCTRHSTSLNGNVRRRHSVVEQFVDALGRVRVGRLLLRLHGELLLLLLSQQTLLLLLQE